MNKVTQKLKELNKLFQRFPNGQAFRELLLFLLQRMLCPNAKLSYAEKGEDLVLAAMLRKMRQGFYVEVGCYHPVRKSNTFGFYKQGWRGIAIDANPIHLEDYRRLRPRDSVVEAAVSDCEQEAKLVCYKESAYSTISQDVANNRNKSIQGKKSTRRVHTKTLTSILDTLDVPEDFNLLSIDCEGHDFEVLRSLNLKQYHPEVIIIEDHDFSVANCTGNSIVRHLTAYDYQLHAFCLNNLYFIRSVVTGSKAVNQLGDTASRDSSQVIIHKNQENSNAKNK